MINLFKFFSKDQSASKDVAKERLRLVLIHDKADVSPNFLEMIKGDIIKVISDYIEIEEEGFEIVMKKTLRDDKKVVPALHANIPIKRMKNIGK